MKKTCGLSNRPRAASIAPRWGGILRLVEACNEYKRRQGIRPADVRVIGRCTFAVMATTRLTDELQIATTNSAGPPDGIDKIEKCAGTQASCMIEGLRSRPDSAV